MTVADFLAHALDEPDGAFVARKSFVALSFTLERELEIASPLGQTDLSESCFAVGVVGDLG